MLKRIGVIITILLLVSGCSDNPTENVDLASGNIGSTLNYGNLDITLEDVYYAQFDQEDVELSFDYYLATDLSVENVGNDQEMFNALKTFTVTDDKDSESSVMIDENRKKFSKGLMSGDTFKITLVFPVNSSYLYELHYSPGKSIKKEDVINWQFSAPSKELKPVEQTIDHRDEAEVASEFFLHDGSNNIEFNGDDKEESDE